MEELAFVQNFELANIENIARVIVEMLSQLRARYRFDRVDWLNFIPPFDVIIHRWSITCLVGGDQ